MAPVLVTGATGFIASHLIQRLLKEGTHVRGTVRNLQNEEKVSMRIMRTAKYLV